MKRRAHQIPGGNTHHLFWPDKDYKTPTERKFRALPCMQVRNMDYFAHHLLHQVLQNIAVPKPSRDDQLLAIQRHDTQQCACYQ